MEAPLWCQPEGVLKHWTCVLYRASFEDLVLEAGRLRWSRLENLLREGSKSTDFDASQLWLLAGACFAQLVSMHS